MSGERPKFLADFMLGRLARWLLLLGYDTAYVSSGETADLDAVARAAAEGRVFLTRDTKIPAVAGTRRIVLKDQDLGGQLRQVFGELGESPDPALYFSRCSACNLPTRAVPREEVLELLPEKVRGLDTAFYRCPSCSKVYWSGTHVWNTLAKLEQIIRKKS